MTASPRQIIGVILVLTVAGLTAWLLAPGPPTVVAAHVDSAPAHHHHRPSPTPRRTGTPSPTGSTSSPTPTPTLTPTITPTIAPTSSAVPSATPSPTPPSARWPVTDLHYTANGNFSSSGQYLPGADGFNLADVGSVSVLDALPAGTNGLVWIGYCEGPDSTFQAMVSPFIGNPKLFGFYMVDEPDPSTCLAANLKAEDDWIRVHVPGARTFAILENLGSSDAPTFANAYTPQNSDLDLIGLDPYPVRSELASPTTRRSVPSARGGSGRLAGNFHRPRLSGVRGRHRDRRRGWTLVTAHG